MTDIAKLVFDIDSTSAVTARKNLDGLTKSAEQVEAASRKVRTASEQAGIGVGNSSRASDMAARAAAEHAKALLRAEREADRAAATFQRLTSAYDPLAGAVLKTNRQLAEAEKLYQKGAISAAQYAATTDGLNAKLANLDQAQKTGVNSSKALQMAGLNLGRQFTDIGVSLAGGINPLMVLIQQGPQIADAFAVAKMQGQGFTAVIRGLTASLVPLLPLMVGVGAAAGVIFGGAALAARELEKDNKNLVASLGLTENQMERLKDKGVDTGVTIGDVFKGTFNYIKGAVAPTLAPVMKWFGELFDKIAKGAVFAVKAIVGGFAGAFASIKSIFSDFPAIMGDLFASGANLAISAIEKLLNVATSGINNLIEKANSVSGKVGGPQLGTIGEFKLGRVNNSNEGAAARGGDAAQAAFIAAYNKAGAGVDKALSDWGKSILDVTKKRIEKAAGDPEKARKTAEIRDMSEERSAQIAAQLEQALADELRARLSMAKEVKDRAELERQIASAEASAKQSRIDAQIAAIADDKGLSDLKKAELTLELQRIQFIQGGIADIQRQAINDKERADLAAEALARTQAEAQNQIDLLQSRQALAQSSYEAAKIEREVVAKRQEMERAALKATIDNATLKESEREIARRRLETLEQIHANELKQLDKTASLLDAMSSAIRAVDDMASAFKSGDIGGGVSALSSALKQASGLLGSSSGLGGTLSGIADFLGPIGGIVSSVTSLFGGLFGGSSKKKKAKAAAAAQAAAEEAARLQTVADTEFELQVALLRAQGDETAALNMEREKELARLAAISQASADYQKKIWELEDATAAAAAASEKAAAIAASRHSLEIQLLEAMGKTDEANAMRLADERAALDESLRGLFDQIQAEKALTSARQDATAAAEAAAEAAASLLASQKRDVDALVSSAQSALQAAYDAQVSAITATRDQMQGFADSFKEFRLGLNGAADSVGDFYKIAARARLGDTAAMGDLVSAAQAADTKAASTARTQTEYLREQGKIRAAVQAAEDTANRQVTIADQQLAALQAQVSGLLTLNTSVLSVADAVKNLNTALGLQSAIYGAVSNPNRQWGANKDANMALVRATGYAGDFGSGGFQAWIEQQPESVKALARESLVASGQAYRIAFKTGGSFEVGGDGGVDTTPVSFMASRGEMVSISREDNMAAMVDELRALRQEVSEMKADARRTADASVQQARILKNVTPDGDRIQTEAAA